MNISSLFQKQQLKPAWSYTAAGVLWRIVFSESNFIIGEDRDTENKRVTFFCLNAVNGDVLWKDVTFAESWWIGIEGVKHDKIFLHGFKKPDMPEHGKIIAVDLGTGRELWHNNDYAFVYATDDRVFAFRDFFEKRKYYELDAANGEFIRELNEPPDGLYEMKNASHGRNDFLFPESLSESHSEYPLVNRHVSLHCDMEQVRGPVEFVRSNGMLVFNFHALTGRDAKNNDVLQNRLCVMEEENGKRIFADVLNDSTPSPVPDSFFIDGGTLYYLKDKMTIVSLTLPLNLR